MIIKFAIVNFLFQKLIVNKLFMKNIWFDVLITFLHFVVYLQ